MTCCAVYAGSKRCVCCSRVECSSPCTLWCVHYHWYEARSAKRPTLPEQETRPSTQATVQTNFNRTARKGGTPHKQRAHQQGASLSSSPTKPHTTQFRNVCGDGWGCTHEETKRGVSFNKSKYNKYSKHPMMHLVPKKDSRNCAAKWLLPQTPVFSLRTE